MKYRFGIDIDGTVTCPTSLIPHINEAYNVNLVLDDIQEYDLTKAFEVDPKQFSKWFQSVEENIYQTSAPQQYVQTILNEWQNNYELFYISARPESVYQTTKDWFEKQAIPYNHIELIGSHYKIEVAKTYGVHAFFEDKHDNAVDLHEALNIPVILFDTPYNRQPIPKGVKRVRNWKEANDWIEKLFPIEE